VVDFDHGANPTPGYDIPSAVLGEPARFTGEGLFDAVVSPFNAPWLPDEVFSIGAGGFITIEFDTPIADDPGNPFGIDFIVFSNASLLDGNWPNGICVGAFSNDPYVVEVSADGEDWIPVSPASQDVLFPTCGFADSAAYDVVPGSVLTDFTKPVDPSLSLADFFMLTHAEVVELYDGSGGGAGFDLAGSGLASISFIRISNPGSPRSTPSVEIDAVARVAPEAGRFADFVTSSTLQPPPDGVVDGADLAYLIGAWGANPGSPADIVDSATLQPPPDGAVDGADLAVLLGAWTQ